MAPDGTPRASETDASTTTTSGAAPSPRLSGHHARYLRRMQLTHVWVVRLIAPTVGLLGSVVLAWLGKIDLPQVAAFVVMYSLSWIGLEVGYHRHFAHGGFRASGRLRGVLGVLGSWSGQGPVIFWTALHRLHHSKSDQPGDPHSPWLHGRDLVGRIKGHFFAHLGWMFAPSSANPMQHARDLLKDPAVAKISRHYYRWWASSFVIAALLGFVFSGFDPWGLLTGFVFAGLGRQWLVHMGAAAVTNLAHSIGRRSFATDDESRDIALVGLLTFGQGLHNHHHAFPSACRLGTTWFHVDLSWPVIRALSAVGLIHNVKVTPQELIDEKRLR